MRKLSTEESKGLAESAKIVTERLNSLFSALDTLDPVIAQEAIRQAHKEYEILMRTVRTFVKRPASA